MNELHERIVLRVMGGTRRRVRKLMKAFPDRWENESHFYRSAIWRFERELQRELFEIKLEKVHEKRLRRTGG